MFQRKGPRTEPCGQPLETRLVTVHPFTDSLTERWAKNERIKSWTFLGQSLLRRARNILECTEENNWNNVLFNPTILPPKRSAIGRSTNQAKRRREYRASETSVQRQARQERDRVHTALARSLETITIPITITVFIQVVRTHTHCGAQKFKNETPGMCCAGGKVKLPDLRSPPEPLLTLVSGEKVNQNIF
ncbi:hypothetical protein LAZ67_12002687 [Cordylochernes scorpioides]|uniref:Uncharacterized protein n=1 Tax=Cordylochernes scorpioides TaxID=51811 RepID=A0ABY6L5X1_9ARAC|nr:hypothetical protein LAZ67_12002687 [Cordylochernes scorpioides]